jgi:gentisate 1,2-dioxygenase
VNPPVDQQAPVVLVGDASADWSGDARYYEYHRAADPLRAGTIGAVPIRGLAPSAPGDPVRTLFDLSHELQTPWPATSPGLLASFIRLGEGERFSSSPVATSELFYVLRGAGTMEVDGARHVWAEGDLFVLPGGVPSDHEAVADSVLYHVTDEPLLAHLGVAPTARRFQPTLFAAEQLSAELARVAAEPGASDRNRVAVLMGTAPQTQTLTVTHTLWAMLGHVPVGAVQPPHRHQSVALDLVVGCAPGCFTLVGPELDRGTGQIVDPVRVDWEAGAAFVTPPGLWHSHHNESGHEARILPIQDAGLHTYLRSLDIRFPAPTTTGDRT